MNEKKHNSILCLKLFFAFHNLKHSVYNTQHDGTAFVLSNMELQKL